jgi:hypothetical protein
MHPIQKKKEENRWQRREGCANAYKGVPESILGWWQRKLMLNPS